jgi:hypothetical protein
VGVPQFVQVGPYRASPDDTAAPASNTAAVVTYGAADGWAHLLAGIAWSYSGSGTLAGGNLLIQDGGTTVFSMDITTAGAGFVPFDPPKRLSSGAALTVTLAAGGSNVSGSINALHTMQPYPPVGGAGLDFRNPFDSQYLPLI